MIYFEWNIRNELIFVNVRRKWINEYKLWLGKMNLYLKYWLEFYESGLLYSFYIFKSIGKILLDYFKYFLRYYVF